MLQPLWLTLTALGFSDPAQTSTPSMNPDIALILDVAGAYLSTDEPLPAGGHDPARTGFNLQQLELTVGAAVDPFLRFDASLVFLTEGVELEEAYGTTQALPGGLQARAGQFLTRFGRQNAIHPHGWAFADQPLVLGKFLGPEGARGLGAELAWLAPLPWFVELVGSATHGAAEHGHGEEEASGEETESTNALEELVYTLALEQFFALDDDWGISFGLSGQLGPYPTSPKERTQLVGADLHVRYKPVDSSRHAALTWTTEALWRVRELPGAAPTDVGGYTQLVWNLNPEWELGARYELVTGSADEPEQLDWPGDRTRISAQLTYYPSHFARLRLQGAHDQPEWRDEPRWSAFLALELIVGAHGAHAY